MCQTPLTSPPGPFFFYHIPGTVYLQMPTGHFQNNLSIFTASRQLTSLKGRTVLAEPLLFLLSPTPSSLFAAQPLSGSVEIYVTSYNFSFQISFQILFQIVKAKIQQWLIMAYKCLLSPPYLSNFIFHYLILVYYLSHIGCLLLLKHSRNPTSSAIFHCEFLVPQIPSPPTSNVIDPKLQDTFSLRLLYSNILKM